ncbi:MAG: hypothetical protein LBE25_10280 [Arthrobacter sp.]|jgi:predicted amidohydrolase|nr:hypothetical protein [Arthrobacter sp.]
MVAVTVAQLPLVVGQREHNLSLAAEAVLAAPRGIVVLPELLNSGYCFRDREESLSLAEPLDGPSVRALTELAARSGSTLVASLAILPAEAPARGEGGVPAPTSAPRRQLLNVAVVIEADGIIGSYTKVHLWGREPEHFLEGTEPPAMVASQFGRLALMVCYDLEFPEFTRLAALAGADLVVAPVNWPLEPRPEGSRAREQIVVEAAARQNRVAFAVCDRTGAERLDEEVGSDWVGGSLIVGQDGFALTPTAYGRPALLSAEVELEASRDKALGPFNDVIKDRRPEVYGF